MFLLGLCSFVLFFVNDINDLRWKRKVLSFCFPLGFGMLALSAVFQSLSHPAPVGTPLRIVFGIISALFLALIIAALFCAVPVRESYTKPGMTRPVQTKGLYALCRHPGVLFFIGFFISLWLSAGFPLYSAAAYIVMNLLLVVFEDRVVFPKVLSGYEEYKKSTPFLIPSRKSIRSCLDSRSNKADRGVSG